MNQKGTHYIRILAGAYLIYLAYSLVKATLTDQLPIFYLIAGIVFGTLGAVFLVLSLLAIRRIGKEQQEGQASGEEEREKQEK